jgi:hypothetical protein
MRTWREPSTRAAPVRPIPAYQPSEADIEPARAGREAGAPADIDAEQASKDLTSIRGPRAISAAPQPNSKTDLLGFYIGMPRAEVDTQFETLGCKPSQERASGIYIHELECKFAQGERLKVLLVKGLVGGNETEVVKSPELIFDYNDGTLWR